ncbi:unnamed protein product [Rhizophagus irregularis]|uniref:Uncharacterized protein n=1 Tax=Rhizophagus irregularis TaxID=588596 RepID=A0A2N1MIT3_9GLOM|nr:hypothetical protein RhiirC2_718346 [Rhizophagus irregularis]CAB4385796.1 unnamed protein product [Rhizophagus irregularis]
MLHKAAENTTDLNLNSGLASLLLINQEENSTITSLEKNPINEDILVPPLNKKILVITPLEEDSTTIPLNEKDNSTTPEYNENEYIFYLEDVQEATQITHKLCSNIQEQKI